MRSGVLREHEAGVKTAELCRKHGISDATFYNWKAEVRRDDCVGGGAVADAGGREPTAEEAAGGVDADVSALKDLLGKKLTRSVDRYAAVEKLMANHGFSERRACRLVGVNRSA